MGGEWGTGQLLHLLPPHHPPKLGDYHSSQWFDLARKKKKGPHCFTFSFPVGIFFFFFSLMKRRTHSGGLFFLLWLVLLDSSSFSSCVLVVVLSCCPVVSDSLRPRGLKHARLPCPSLSPGVFSHSYPLNQWCHPIILSSVVLFSSCLQCFPPSGSFPMSHLFVWGVLSIGTLVSASVLPINIQDWLPLGLTGLILQSKGLSSLLQHHSPKASILWCSAFFIRQDWVTFTFTFSAFMVQLSHLYITTGKTIALTIQSFVGNVHLLVALFSTFLYCGKNRSEWHILLVYFHCWHLATSKSYLLKPAVCAWDYSLVSVYKKIIISVFTASLFSPRVSSYYGQFGERSNI